MKKFSRLQLKRAIQFASGEPPIGEIKTVKRKQKPKDIENDQRDMKMRGVEFMIPKGYRRPLIYDGSPRVEGASMPMAGFVNAKAIVNDPAYPSLDHTKPDVIKASKGGIIHEQSLQKHIKHTQKQFPRKAGEGMLAHATRVAPAATAQKRSLRGHEISHSLIQHKRGRAPESFRELLGEETRAYTRQFMPNVAKGKYKKALTNAVKSPIKSAVSAIQAGVGIPASMIIGRAHIKRFSAGNQSSKPKRKRGEAIDRLRNALIVGTAGGYLGDMIGPSDSKAGARAGVAIGALVGALSKRRKTREAASTVSGGGEYAFEKKDRPSDGKIIAEAATGAAAIKYSLNPALGLKRVHHGTSGAHWEGIKKEGLKPSHGGKATGSGGIVGNQKFMRNSQGKVHVTGFKPMAAGFASLHKKPKIVSATISHKDFLKREVDPDMGFVGNDNFGRRIASRSRKAIKPTQIHGSDAPVEKKIGQRIRDMRRGITASPRRTAAGVAGVVAGAGLLAKTVNDIKKRREQSREFSSDFKGFRKEHQNPNGGLNAKGRAAYNKATGSDLKRPQPDGGKRRDSFCARMNGMKAKLTSEKTARDPDSRINKSLRAWDCEALVKRIELAKRDPRDNWRRGGYISGISGNTEAIKQGIEEGDAYEKKGVVYRKRDAVKHAAAPVGAGLLASSAAAKAVNSWNRKNPLRASTPQQAIMGMAKRRAIGNVLVAVAGIGAAKLASSATQKMRERDRKKATKKTHFSAKSEDQKMREAMRTETKSQHIQNNTKSYIQSAIGGGLAGAAIGGVLAGKAGVTKGTIGAGAAIGAALRASRQKKINRAEDKFLRKNNPSPVEHVKENLRSVGRNLIVPAGLLAVGAGAAAARKPLNRAAKVAGKKVRAVGRLARQKGYLPKKNGVTRTRGVPRGNGPIVDADTGKLFPQLMGRFDFAEKRDKTSKVRDVAIGAGALMAGGAAIHAARKIGSSSEAIAKSVQGITPKSVASAIGAEAEKNAKRAVQSGKSRIANAVRKLKWMAGLRARGFDVTLDNVREFAHYPAYHPLYQAPGDETWEGETYKPARRKAQTPEEHEEVRRDRQALVRGAIKGAAIAAPLAYVFKDSPGGLAAQKYAKGMLAKASGKLTGKQPVVPVKSKVVQSGIKKATKKVATPKKPVKTTKPTMPKKKKLSAIVRKMIEFGGQQQILNKQGRRYADPIKVAVGIQQGVIPEIDANGEKIKDRFKENGVWKTRVRMKDVDLPVHHGQVVRTVYKKAHSVAKWSDRTGGLAKDVTDTVRGIPREKDAYGRRKKREWEKGWFKRAATGAAIGTAGLAVLKSDKGKALVKKGLINAEKVKRSILPDLSTFGDERRILNLVSGIDRALTYFDSSAPNWDIRHESASGKSARVYAPESRPRERRQKYWHERLENERKLWAAGLATSAVAGALGHKKLTKIISDRASKRPMPKNVVKMPKMA